jgi:hypothetical protein
MVEDTTDSRKEVSSCGREQLTVSDGVKNGEPSSSFQQSKDDSIWIKQKLLLSRRLPYTR